MSFPEDLFDLSEPEDLSERELLLLSESKSWSMSVS
jgi:hypothetical protein